jgi:hypothetical protein
VGRIARIAAVLVAALPLTGCAGFGAVMQARLVAFEMQLHPTGLNRTVEACRAAIWTKAVELGAREIEAVSAGPDQLNEKGQYVGPVRTWITYERPNGYEVREATLTCVTDPEGKFVDAFDPATSVSKGQDGSQLRETPPHA